MQLINKQPRGFATFFMTEMWERYGFYVIQTLLIFYLISKFHMDDHNAYVIVGSFTALAYINSIFGGYIADKFIGMDQTLLIGGVLLFIGNCILGMGALGGFSFVCVGLSFITVGTGLLKPNVSSMLGTLYEKQVDLKDSGYTLYYTGIYVGAVSGTFLGGYLQRFFGWGTTFYISALGICIALASFWLGRKRYNLFDKRMGDVNAWHYVITCLSLVVLVIISYFVLSSELLAEIYLILMAILCAFYLLFNIAYYEGIVRTRLIAFFILVIFSSFYWGINFQQFFSISLCTLRTTNLTIPPSALISVESFGIIIFGPIVNWMWLYYQRSGKNKSIPTKFNYSFMFNALCFLTLTIGLWFARLNHTYLNVTVIIIAYLWVSVGALCISPTSLSMVTYLVPEKLTSAMMGISLLSIGFGGKMAGYLAGSAELASNNKSLQGFQSIYMYTFLKYFVISLVIFVIGKVLVPYLERLIDMPINQKNIR